MATKKTESILDIIAQERGILQGSAAVANATSKWINARINSFAAKAPRDEKSAASLAAELKAELVSACLEIGRRPAAEGGLGAKARGLENRPEWAIVEAVLGAQRVGSWKSALSGVRMAYVHNRAWSASIYAQLKKEAAEAAAAASAAPSGKQAAGRTAAGAKVEQAPATSEGVKGDVLAALTAVLAGHPDRLEEVAQLARQRGWI